MRARPTGRLAAALVALTALAPAAAHASHARFTHLSPGGGVNADGRPVAFLGASADSSRIFFGSWEQLTYQDRDGSGNDVYERSAAGLRLISTSQYEPDGFSSSAQFGAVSDDGEHVFFSHTASLAPEDTDTDRDVYERVGDTVRLVSTGQHDNPGAHFAWFEAGSADGERAVFHTTERLIFEDDDDEVDLYARAHGRTELVTYAPGETQEPRSTSFKGASRDAQVVVFEAADPPVGSVYDAELYVRTRAGTVALPGGSTSDFYTGPRYRGMSDDGARIFYETSASLVPEDTDGWEDVYEFSDGSAKLLSHGPAGGNGRFFPVFKRASADGSRVFFETGEQLVPEDTDERLDVYERNGADIRLVSTGPSGGNGAHDATLRAVSPDGTTAYYETKERMTPDDGDSEYRDVYARSGEATTLVSDVPSYADATFWWASPDGRVAVFAFGSSYFVREEGVAHPIVPNMPLTQERLVFRSASPDAGRVVFESDDRLMGSDQDNVTDLYELGPGDPTRYARPQGASHLRVPIVPAFKECTAPNTSHGQGSSLATGGCNPPVAESRHLTVGTADFNERPTRSQGALSLAVVAGDPATPEDEADVEVGFRLTDVRRSDDLADYTGELQVRATLRLTDRSNGPSQEYPGTAQDLEFGFTVPCSATDDELVGGTCALSSRLKALRCCMPRLEGRRTVMRVDDIRVYDGGPDGRTATAADTDVFAWSGLFIP